MGCQNTPILSTEACTQVDLVLFTIVIEFVNRSRRILEMIEGKTVVRVNKKSYATLY